jgi:hypothetical protein
MHVNLKCRCGLKIPVTKEQANGSVQCRSCLNRIHVPNEKALVDLGAFERDVRLRIVCSIVLGALVIAAIAAGVFTQSKRESLGDQAYNVRKGELSDNPKNSLPKLIDELKAKNQQSSEIGALEEARDRLKSMPEDARELKARANEVRETLKSIDPEYRMQITKDFLADADFADFAQTLLYGFVGGAGVCILLLIVISARVSTHRHRLIAYEKQTHTKVISR